MVLNDNSLEEKAQKTFELLIKSLITDDVLSDIVITYHKTIEEPLTDTFGIRRKLPFDEDDYRRIIFELICFATFLIMVHEAPKYLKKGVLLFNESPDAEKIRYYNTKLYDLLNDYLDNHGYNGIHEIVPIEITPELKYGIGEAIDLTSRVTLYASLEDFQSATKIFVIRLTYAIDADNFAFVEPKSIFYAGSIIDLVRDIAKYVFS